MIVLLIVLYLIIGLIVSIIGTYVLYKTSCRTDIDDYFTYDFSLAATIIVLLLWPIVLFLLFSMYGITNLYMVATILLDNFFEKRRKKK